MVIWEEINGNYGFLYSIKDNKAVSGVTDKYTFISEPITEVHPQCNKRKFKHVYSLAFVYRVHVDDRCMVTCASTVKSRLSLRRLASI